MPLRFVLARLLVLASLVGSLAGCGAGSSAGDLDHIQVTFSQFAVTVTNVSGHKLTDVVAEIVPVGPGTHFRSRPETLSNGESRTLAHSDFMDGDSVPYSPRNKRATQVIVNAKDLDGKDVHVEVPFQM